MESRKKIKILLIVGNPKDVFVYNYAKWLKMTTNCSIDVFGFFPSNKYNCSYQYYDNVGEATTCTIRYVRSLMNPFIKNKNLNTFLKGKYYDIIHCQWVTSPMVIQNNIKAYCRKFIITFWGGEFKTQTILMSKKLYRYFLNRLSKHVDCIIREKNGKSRLPELLPYFRGLYRTASLGSAPMEALYSLMAVEDKSSSKEKLNMPSNKVIVLIGYSGKSIHRHIQIIKELSKYPELQNKIHLFAPMTRGGEESYIQLVEECLKASGFSYTLLSGRFLNDEDVARTRNATDVVMQLSEFDGVSRSIIECLCARAVMIYGDWLNYDQYLLPYGFEGISVSSIETGVAKLSHLVDDINNYEEITHRNSENGRNIALWSECIKDWVNAYEELLND